MNINKTVIRSIVYIFFGLFGLQHVSAQELNINVKVQSPATTTADPSLYVKLEKEIRELLNNTQWTSVEYEDYERIEGNFNLIISKELSATSFEAELALQTSRPVFGSMYKTPVISTIDKHVVFTYDGIQPVVNSSQVYVDNLSSIVSFYAYMMIGMDADTYALEGGRSYYEKALQVYNNLPSSAQRGDKGWSSSSIKENNRYFFMDNCLSPTHKEFRSAIYDYHRLGLDIMEKDYGKARVILSSAITSIGSVHEKHPKSGLIRMFSDAKRSEFIEIFKVADAGEKSKVKSILSKIDPSSASIYRSNIK